MNYMNDTELLKQFEKERRLKPKTMESYKNTLDTYTRFSNKTMVELLQEAEDEEEQKIRWAKRKLRKRLIEFRVYLLDNLKLTTANTYFTKIKTIYRHFSIEIHDLPKVSTKGANIAKQVTYDELLTKDEIKEILKVTKPVYRAIILFMLSSGCARAETLALTIGDFINSLQEYTTKQDMNVILKELQNQEDIIPTFKIRRIKTNKYYYTFCSPEAVQYIFAYLQSTDRELKPSEKLFVAQDKHLSRVFSKINQKLDLGTAGTYNRFRTHTLRKFHASNLAKGEHPLTPDEIDSLQGRSKDTVRSSYFFDDPKFLKEKYILNMNQVSINQEVNNISIDSPEVLEIKREKNQLLDKLNSLEDSIPSIVESVLDNMKWNNKK